MRGKQQKIENKKITKRVKGYDENIGRKIKNKKGGKIVIQDSKYKKRTVRNTFKNFKDYTVAERTGMSSVHCFSFFSIRRIKKKINKKNNIPFYL